MTISAGTTDILVYQSEDEEIMKLAFDHLWLQDAIPLDKAIHVQASCAWNHSIRIVSTW